MNAKVLLTALPVLILAGCSQTRPLEDPGRSSARAAWTIRIVGISDMNPLEFLSHLQKMERETAEIAVVRPDWVQEVHLPKLFALLDSDKKCAPVVATGWAPHVDIDKPSTVGREAGFLIKSFRTEQYPAPLDSVMSDADKRELRQWWRKYRDGKD